MGVPCEPRAAAGAGADVPSAPLASSVPSAAPWPASLEPPPLPPPPSAGATGATCVPGASPSSSSCSSSSPSARYGDRHFLVFKRPNRALCATPPLPTSTRAARATEPGAAPASLEEAAASAASAAVSAAASAASAASATASTAVSAATFATAPARECPGGGCQGPTGCSSRPALASASERPPEGVFALNGVLALDSALVLALGALADGLLALCGGRSASGRSDALAPAAAAVKNVPSVRGR